MKPPRINHLLSPNQSLATTSRPLHNCSNSTISGSQWHAATKLRAKGGGAKTQVFFQKNWEMFIGTGGFKPKHTKTINEKNNNRWGFKPINWHIIFVISVAVGFTLKHQETFVPASSGTARAKELNRALRRLMCGSVGQINELDRCLGKCGEDDVCRKNILEIKNCESRTDVAQKFSHLPRRQAATCDYEDRAAKRRRLHPVEWPQAAPAATATAVEEVWDPKEIVSQKDPTRNQMAVVFFNVWLLNMWSWILLLSKCFGFEPDLGQAVTETPARRFTEATAQLNSGVQRFDPVYIDSSEKKAGRNWSKHEKDPVVVLFPKEQMNVGEAQMIVESETKKRNQNLWFEAYVAGLTMPQVTQMGPEGFTFEVVLRKAAGAFLGIDMLPAPGLPRFTKVWNPKWFLLSIFSLGKKKWDNQKCGNRRGTKKSLFDGQAGLAGWRGGCMEPSVQRICLCHSSRHRSFNGWHFGFTFLESESKILRFFLVDVRDFLDLWTKSQPAIFKLFPTGLSGFRWLHHPRERRDGRHHSLHGGDAGAVRAAPDHSEAKKDELVGKTTVDIRKP